MGFKECETTGKIEWTYEMEDGVCTDSVSFSFHSRQCFFLAAANLLITIFIFVQLALLTAATFGLEDTIIERAKEFSKLWNSDGDRKKVLSNDLEVDNKIFGTTPVEQLLKETAGQATPVCIPPQHQPPPSFEGSSCVYVFQLSDGRYYVGESDSIMQRISQHRSKGEEWVMASVTAIQVGDKSSARSIEKVMIERMAKEGYEMVSIADGR
jgi:predicted GIY-YIG superfamily endonuclease